MKIRRSNHPTSAYPAPLLCALSASLVLFAPNLGRAVNPPSSMIQVEAALAEFEHHCGPSGWDESWNYTPLFNTSGAHESVGSVRLSASYGQVEALGCQAGSEEGGFDVPDRLFAGPGDPDATVCVVAPDITGRYDSGTCAGQCNLSAPGAESYAFFNYDAPNPSADCFADDPALSSCGASSDEWVAGTIVSLRLPYGNRLGSSVAPGVYLNGDNQFNAFASANAGLCSDNGAACGPTDRTSCGDPATARCVHMTHTPAVVYDWRANQSIDEVTGASSGGYDRIRIFVPDALDASVTDPNHKSSFRLGESVVGTGGYRPSVGGTARGYSLEGDYDTTLHVDIRGATPFYYPGHAISYGYLMELELEVPDSSPIQFSDLSPQVGQVLLRSDCP